jgi:hypothetical protein
MHVDRMYKIKLQGSQIKYIHRNQVRNDQYQQAEQKDPSLRSFYWVRCANAALRHSGASGDLANLEASFFSKLKNLFLTITCQHLSSGDTWRLTQASEVVSEERDAAQYTEDQVEQG